MCHTNIVNIYEYYSDKNTLTDQIKHSKISGEDLEKYEIKKVENNDNSITYEFYDDSFNLIKKEIYVGDILIHRDTLKCSRKEYFTPDGYKYLDTCLGRKQSDEKARYFLNNRETSSTIEFTISEFDILTKLISYSLKLHLQFHYYHLLAFLGNLFNGYLIYDDAV